ncbi:P-loop containing nucleoside triphosphate hydrolase protein [Serendipita vermifera]|nr:P-loop containing nucleoside triphosphate hydrolase protein [Serendipita vermifera]
MSLAHPFYLFRIILLGEEKVGKTCIFRRFADDSFVEEYDPTIAYDCVIRMVEVKGRVIEVHVIDLSGDPRWEPYGAPWMRDKEAFIFVFDMTNPRSFDGLARWLKKAKCCLLLFVPLIAHVHKRGSVAGDQTSLVCLPCSPTLVSTGYEPCACSLTKGTFVSVETA